MLTALTNPALLLGRTAAQVPSSWMTVGAAISAAVTFFGKPQAVSEGIKGEHQKGEKIQKRKGRNLKDSVKRGITHLLRS